MNVEDVKNEVEKYLKIDVQFEARVVLAGDCENWHMKNSLCLTKIWGTECWPPSPGFGNELCLGGPLAILK